VDGGGEAGGASYGEEKVRVGSRVPRKILTGTVVIHAILFTIMRSSKQ
jgi:preprotein translocase subunit SecG